MTHSFVKLVQDMQDRIGDPQFWVKGKFLHYETLPSGERIQQVCLDGCKSVVLSKAPGLVLNKATGVPGLGFEWWLNNVCEDYTLTEVYRGVFLISFNDRADTTHDDVMLFLAHALEMAEQLEDD